MVKANRFRQLLNSDVGKILISILFALGLASVFRSSCKEDSCIVRKVPNRYDMQNTLYKDQDECYRVKIRETDCDNDKKSYIIE